MKQNRTILSSWQSFLQSRYLILVFCLLTLNFPGLSKSYSQIIRKSKIQFTGVDNLIITADNYFSRKDNPYILLFHTERSSRGEFDSLAYRFAKMHYNCLAVDLRSGDSYGYIKNETALYARKKGFDNRLASVEKDIISSIDYIRTISDQNVILLGSSSSATMAIKTATSQTGIDGVIALSPGEFFIPEYELADNIQDIGFPLFLAGNSNEAKYLEKMVSTKNDDSAISIAVSSASGNVRGSDLLRKSNPSSDEYWMSVLIFIRSIKRNPDGKIPDSSL